MSFNTMYARFILVFSLFICPCYGITYTKIDTPQRGILPVLTMSESHAFTSFKITKSDGNGAIFHTEKLERRVNGWGEWVNIESVQMKDLGFSASDEFVPQWAADNGTALLLTQLTCDETCIAIADVLLVKKENWSIASRTALECSEPRKPQLHSEISGITLLWKNACSDIFTINNDVSIEPAEELSRLDNLEVLLDGTLVGWSLQQKDEGSEFKLMSESRQDITTILPKIVDQCWFDPVANSPESFICNYNDDSGYRITLSGDALDVADVNLTQPGPLKFITIKEHTYLISNKNGGFVWNHSANTSMSVYSRHSINSSPSSTDPRFIWQSSPIWSASEPSMFVSIPWMGPQNRVFFILFDGLEMNSPPYQHSASEYTLTSGTVRNDIRYPVFDEEELLEQLTVTAQERPSWASLPPPLSASNWTFIPQHEDVGEYNWVEQITDSSGRSAIIQFSASVTLDPLRIFAFEDYWFKQWKLDEPVQLDVLLTQVKELPSMEDQITEWKLTVKNRRKSDLSFQINPASDFVVLAESQDENDPSVYLRISPSQRDVGIHEFTLQVTDKFSLIPNMVVVPIEVLLFDDPFVIESSPPLGAVSDEPYVYEIKTADEETGAEDMSYTVISMPSFISFDHSKRIFSGIPSSRDIGVHPIAILIMDKGGNRMVHQWNITVVAPDQTTSGGGLCFFVLFLLMLCIARTSKVE